MRAIVLLLALVILPVRVRAAGDIQAVVTDGVLDVEGDDESNVFRIAAGTEAGAVVVSGLEATTVNGGGQPVALAGVGSLRIVAGGGDDRIELLQLDLDEKLLVKLGKGHDGLVLQDVRVRGRARIKGSADRDDVTIRGFSRFSDQLIIETGRGPDAVTLTNVGLARGVHIDTGGGADTVLVQFCGLDPGEEMLVRSGNGEDAVTLLGSDFFDDVELDLGDDDDDVLVEDCDFDQEFDADGGDGDDEFDFDGTNTFEPDERQRIVDFEALT
jgi:hypothetical protein